MRLFFLLVTTTLGLGVNANPAAIATHQVQGHLEGLSAESAPGKYSDFDAPFVRNPVVAANNRQAVFGGGMERLADNTAAVASLSEQDALSRRRPRLYPALENGTETFVLYGALALVPCLGFGYWLISLVREVRARKRSEAHLRSLYTSMTIGFALHEVVRDSEGEIVDYRYLEVNPAFEELTGSNREHWLGHSVREILPKTADFWIKNFGEVANSGKSQVFESYSEEIGRWFFTCCYRPQIDRLAVLMQDISERKRTEHREQARNKVLEQLASGAPLGGILESIVSSVEQEEPGMICCVLLLDPERKRFSIAAAPSLPEASLADLRSRIVDNQALLFRLLNLPFENNALTPSTEEQSHDTQHAISFESDLACCYLEPIQVASNRPLGALMVCHQELNTPSADEIELIKHTANLAAVAIDRSQSNEALRLAHMVYQNCTEAMLVTDSKNRILTINPAFTRMTDYTMEEVVGRGPKFLASRRNGKRFYRRIWETLQQDGQWRGEIWNRCKNGREFASWLTINTIYAADGSVQRRVALFSDISEKKRADALIWAQANYDPLTQLPNRRLFRDRLEQEVRKSNRDHQVFALLYLDLDGFKEINDTLGHNMGDELLVETANRIRSCVRESDTIARLGGDEFTIILPELSAASDAEKIAESLIRILNKPFILDTDQSYISASIGITVYPNDAKNVEALLQNADQAMYAAKNEGRGRWSYFTPSMQLAAQRRVRLARDLRLALAETQFQMYYQPIVDLNSGSIQKMEALLRWQHPVSGFISPADFIPIAEETGVIHEIGDWVFRTATAQLKQWRGRFRTDFQISINKSPVQFHTPRHIHEHWIDYLREVGLDGSNITIEITEGLLLNAEPEVVKKLLYFRDLGIQVAIDDFGTGYSSLAYLKKFSIDYLKIDQSFTRSLAPNSEDLALCEAVVVMAHKLGLKVIAEGVETPQQRNLLYDIGCDFGQGFLFSKPLNKKGFEDLIETRAQYRYN